jgi:hypothetical protein
MNDNQGSPVAHDDDGQPITDQDLMTESYQKPLRGRLGTAAAHRSRAGTAASGKGVSAGR